MTDVPAARTPSLIDAELKAARSELLVVERQRQDAVAAMNRSAFETYAGPVLFFLGGLVGVTAAVIRAVPVNDVAAWSAVAVLCTLLALAYTADVRATRRWAPYGLVDALDRSKTLNRTVNALVLERTNVETD